MGGGGRPHSDPIGTFGGVLLGSFGVIVGEGETPVWDPIGFGVGPVRGIEGDGGDPNMGPYRIWGLALLGAMWGEEGDGRPQYGTL